MAVFRENSFSSLSSGSLERDSREDDATTPLLESTTPLLGSDLASENDCLTGSFFSTSSLFLSEKRRISIMVTCAIATLTLDMGLTIIAAPKVRLYESIICAKYYSSAGGVSLFQSGGIPEEQCKISEVQAPLARIIGWQVLFDSLPAILLAIPYGALSDSRGRKPVVMSSFLGLTLSTTWIFFVCWSGLPLQLTWLSSIFQFIGGGAIVASAAMETIVTDVVTNEKRAIIFFILQATVLCADILAPPLSSILMEYSVWIPCVLGLGIQLLGTAITIIIPETLHLSVFHRDPAVNSDGNTRPSLTRQLKTNLASIFRNRKVATLVISLMILTIGNESIDFLLQYLSKRYGWPIAKAAIMLSLRAIVEAVLLLTVLPVLVLVLTKTKIPAMSRDLLIARTSSVMIVVGFMILAFSVQVLPAIFGLVIYTCGAGFQAAMMSLLASLWKSENLGNVGSMYSVVAMIMSSGGAIAGPFLSETFTWGLELGGVWVGLPFFMSACICAIVSVVLWSFRIPKETVTTSVDECDHDREL
ncbi:major facilitator superfamily domain-containing protein [Talaromyces proteolyticus]|uniref:Major facilitator superfamily domain-containing protein n=1 Tax=Talaromyces proteolyticus TaxID=1131652 RepID=A0AAD4KJL1_9EURO|nr:major facilitator superfamily domain-containing protein [Talaromyces proteolyticus]KAH8693930.1 major facilitator superfamily domain-containing protein [Talaromyces proteolyticus]